MIIILNIKRFFIFVFQILHTLQPAVFNKITLKFKLITSITFWTVDSTLGPFVDCPVRNFNAKLDIPSLNLYIMHCAYM